MNPETDPTTACAPAAEDRPQRDADLTKQRLVEAARERFARDGYRATTVRAISEDAGVNVALISRYFGSKAGLFRTCLTGTARALDVSLPMPLPPDLLAGRIARAICGEDDQQAPYRLQLLVRASGDPEAESIRLSILRAFAEKIVRVLTGQAAEDVSVELRLRAQTVMATVLGMSILRSTPEIQPMASASAEDLTETLTVLLRTLITAPA